MEHLPDFRESTSSWSNHRGAIRGSSSHVSDLDLPNTHTHTHTHSLSLSLSLFYPYFVVLLTSNGWFLTDRFVPSSSATTLASDGSQRILLFGEAGVWEATWDGTATLRVYVTRSQALLRPSLLHRAQRHRADQQEEEETARGGGGGYGIAAQAAGVRDLVVIFGGGNGLHALGVSAKVTGSEIRGGVPSLRRLGEGLERAPPDCQLITS